MQDGVPMTESLFGPAKRILNVYIWRWNDRMLRNRL